jgi:3-hydroxybutyryl-CoA dehydratase
MAEKTDRTGGNRMEQNAEIAPRKGLYFEDFAVGQRVVSQGRTITEADIVAFAGLTGDWNPLHTDAEHARGTLFGERIAHGLLILSVASGLASRLGFMEGTVEAFLGLEWKFRAPVKIGDTVHLEAQVAGVRAMPRLGGGIVTFDVKVINQRNETVEKGTWEVLVKSKGSS